MIKLPRPNIPPQHLVDTLLEEIVDDLQPFIKLSDRSEVYQVLAKYFQSIHVTNMLDKRAIAYNKGKREEMEQHYRAHSYANIAQELKAFSFFYHTEEDYSHNQTYSVIVLKPWKEK
jgi:hypothetical protein